MSDTMFMQRALELAKCARDSGEVPVGAVLVKEGEIVGEGYNSPISNNDVSAHAEILALRSANQVLNNYRLPQTTLYVTLEPCSMCAGALVHARVQRVVIAAREPRGGAAGSVLNVLQNPEFNHQCEVEFGLLEPQGSELLQAFFREKRELAKARKRANRQ